MPFHSNLNPKFSLITFENPLTKFLTLTLLHLKFDDIITSAGNGHHQCLNIIELDTIFLNVAASTSGIIDLLTVHLQYIFVVA